VEIAITNCTAQFVNWQTVAQFADCAVLCAFCSAHFANL